MRRAVTNEELMAYLDQELAPEAHSRVEVELARSTELQRELAIWRAMQTDLGELSFAPRSDTSVWDAVDRRLTRPVGWILFASGALLWMMYAGWVFATSEANPWEKVAVGALVAGFLILLASTIFERMREFRTDPYRDIHR